MFPFILILMALVLLVLSFFSLPFVGFPAWSIAMFLLGLGIGLAVSRRVAFKIVAKERVSR